MNKSYYAVIPATVRYDKEITAMAKLLYGEITALCNDKGFCWASNSYFAQLYNVSNRTVINWINSLINGGYIKTEVEYEGNTKVVKQRRIYLLVGNLTSEEMYENPCENDLDTPSEKNFTTPVKTVTDPREKNFTTPVKKVSDPREKSFTTPVKKVSNPREKSFTTPSETFFTENITAINNTDNNTSFKNTNNISSFIHSTGSIESKAKTEGTNDYEEICKRIDFNKLIQESPKQAKFYLYIQAVLSSVLKSDRSIRVRGQEIPKDMILEEYRKLDASMIKAVAKNYSKCQSKVKDMFAYLASALYQMPQITEAGKSGCNANSYDLEFFDSFSEANLSSDMRRGVMDQWLLNTGFDFGNKENL